MIVQDVSTLFTFNPHGGPITHRSQDWNLTLLYPLLSKIFLELDFVCKSRATCLVIYSGIRRNTYSHCSEPLSHFVSGIERLPMCLKLLWCTFLLGSWYFLKIQFESNFRHLPRCYRPDRQPCRGLSFWSYPLSFSYVRWRPRRKDDNFIMMLWNKELKTSTKGINFFVKIR